MHEQDLLSRFPRLRLVLALACLSLGAQTMAQEQQLAYTESFTQQLHVPYLLILPKGYKRDGHRWPILLYLHGAGERGSNLALLNRTPAVRVAETATDLPFIFVAPQESEFEGTWTWPAETDAVLHILNRVLASYNADPDRVYLTGVSMGGWGAWFLAKSHPEMFAAVAPLCGFPEVRWASPQLARLPIWTFQGMKDAVVNPEDTENMVVALQKLGGSPKFTPLVGMGHDIDAAVYERKDLYQWFLQHSRRDTDRPHTQ